MLASIIEHIQPEIHPMELVVGYNYNGSDDGQWLEVGLIPRRGDALKELKQYLGLGQLSRIRNRVRRIRLRKDGNRPGASRLLPGDATGVHPG